MSIYNFTEKKIQKQKFISYKHITRMALVSIFYIIKKEVQNFFFTSPP